MTIIKDQAELETYLAVGGQLIEVFKAVEQALYSGNQLTSRQLDALIESEISKRGGVAVFKGYQGYPAASCISVNEGVVHCIPNDRVFEAGDIVSIDIGFKKDGWIADSTFTFGIWPISQEAFKFMSKSYQLLRRAVKSARPGITVTELSGQIAKAGKEIGIGVVPHLTGHAVGHQLHEDPMIPNVATDDPTVLLEGCIIALEPITSNGSIDLIEEDDGWTTITSDGSLAGHYEESLVLSGDGAISATPLQELWARQEEFAKTLA